MGILDRSIAEAVSIDLGPEYRSLESRARDVVAKEIAPLEAEESDEAGVRMVRALGAAGLLEPCIDLDVTAICVLREIVARSSGLADSMLALQGLGYGPLALAGTEAQKSEWGPRVKRGEAIAAIAITEHEAGSDVASIATTARKDGGEWVIDGTKCFITNAGIADFYVVIARTGGEGSSGLSAIWVPADRVRLVERYQLVAPHPCGEVAFDGARVPLANLVGVEGGGFKLAMATLDCFRPTVGAAAVGMAARALDEAIARSRSRRQFGKPIAQFQQIAAMIADSWAELEAARLLVHRAASAHRGKDVHAGMLSSAAKMLATESAQRIIDRAVQIHGGQGVRKGSAVERLYREIRALRIYEGTTEIQRVVLSRGLLG
jgi:acyl-CoA dehydrogenase